MLAPLGVLVVLAFPAVLVYTSTPSKGVGSKLSTIVVRVTNVSSVAVGAGTSVGIELSMNACKKPYPPHVCFPSPGQV